MSAHTPTAIAEVLNDLESISSDMDDYPSWLDTVNRSMLVINGLVSTHDQLLAERDALLATAAKLRELLLAVVVRDDLEISCADVNGKNWFDARDAALPTPSVQK